MEIGVDISESANTNYFAPWSYQHDDIYRLRKPVIISETLSGRGKFTIEHFN